MALLMFRTFGVIIVSFIVLIMYVLHRKKAYLQMDEDAEKIYKYIENNGGQLGYTDKAKPEVIREDFQMSKSEFKRAIGRLLKEHRIIIGESNIFLNK